MGRDRRRQDRDRKGHPGDAAGQGLAKSPRSPRAIPARARAAAKTLGIPRAYGSYEELLADPEIEAIYNPLAQRGACSLDAESARGRQARLVREADRPRRRRGAPADRRAQPLRQAGRRSLHGALPSAMAARARACAGWDDRGNAGDPDLLLLPAARPGQRAQSASGRRRPLRHRLLRHPHRALHFRRGADAGRRHDRLGPEVQDRSPRERPARVPRRAPADLHRRHATRRRTSA